MYANTVIEHLDVFEYGGSCLSLCLEFETMTYAESKIK